jgi:hypothetical protein
VLLLLHRAVLVAAALPISPTLLHCLPWTIDILIVGAHLTEARRA